MQRRVALRNLLTTSLGWLAGHRMVPASTLAHVGAAPVSAGGSATGHQVNAQRVPGVPWVNAELYGTVADGVHDDAAAIQAALTATGSLRTPMTVFLPSGTMRLGSTLTVPANVTLRGQGPSTILKPTAAVATCIVVSGGAALERLCLDGVNTAGCVGVSIGVMALVGNLFVRDVQVRHFKGSGAAGMFLSQGVTVSCVDSYFDLNENNLITGGTSTPTNSVFLNCQFREAVHKGIWVQSAYSVLFLSCLFESNGEEGVYFASAAGNGLDVRIWDCWFENNWNRIALGTSRHAQYECVVDGQGMGTIRPEFRSCYFSGGTTSARSIRLTTAIDYLIDHVKVFNEPANILIDGTSYGTFVNWPNQNGAYLTTVSIVKTAAATNTESRLTDVVEAAWDTWMPVVTPSGAMTLTGLNVQRARWKQIGKVVHVSIALSFTVGGTPSANLGISLPAALRFPSDDASCFSAFGSDPATDLLLPAYARLVHGTPSGFRLSRVDGRNWILGSPTRLTVNATFEIL